MEESEIGNSFDSHEDVKPSAEALECSLVEYERTLSGPNCLSEVKSGKGALHSENFTRHEPSTFCNTGCDVDVKSEDEDTRSFASEYERTGSGSNCAQDVKLEQGLLPSGKIKLSDCGPSLCRSIGSSDVPVQMRFTYRNVFKEEPEQSIDFVTEDQLAAGETQPGEVVNEVSEQSFPDAGDVSGLATKRPPKPGSILSGADLLATYPPPRSVRALSKSLLTGAVFLTEVSAKPVVCSQPKWEATRTATRKPTPETHLEEHKLVHPTANWYTCDICGHHRLAHTGDSPFCSDKCGKRSHIRSQQALLAPYPMQIGDGVSKSLLTGAVHLMVQPEKTPKPIPDLDSLVGVEGLALVRAQAGLKPFKCDRCPQAFKSKTLLEQHVLVHTEAKPFACDICGKTYKAKAGCEYHRLSHTGEKPFSCDVCGKKFRSSNEVKRHMTSHKSDRPNKCEVCGKCFKQKAHLATHMLSHREEKQFLCDRCGKGFSIRCNMLVHRKLHDGKVS